MLIGVVGTIAAGKGTVTDFLQDRGFDTCSLSDFIRQEATKRNLSHDRTTLQDLGNELRTKYGPGALMQLALAGIDTEHAVIESIRNPEEARLLKERGGVLIGVDANPMLRFKREQERALSTGRTPSATTYEAFLVSEGRELSNDPNGLQLHTVMAMADHIIHNNGSQEELFKHVESVLLPLLEQDGFALTRKT